MSYHTRFPHRRAGSHRIDLRRSASFASVALVLSVVAAGAREPRQSPPAGAAMTPRQSAQRPGAIMLRNSGRDSMRVEVRVGSSACAVLRPAAVRVLAPGQRWLVAGDKPICWRRDRNRLGQPANWTAWQRRVVAAGQRLELVP